MRLTGEKLNKRHGAREILSDCALTIETGECVLLRGPSGGGKSTLLRVLALLEQADSGTVVHGEKRFDAGGKVRSSYPFLTVVFQQLFLWPNLTMAENMGIVLHHNPAAQLGAEEMALLERFSIASLLKRMPHECSLGERQRLAVSRALLSDAQFLLLDEPSSALDKVNRALLVDEIANAAAVGRGVLVVTHDDHAFDEVATHCFELENAKLIASEV